MGTHVDVVQGNSGNQDMADVSRRGCSDKTIGCSFREGRSDSCERGRSDTDRYHDSLRRGDSVYDSDEEFCRRRREGSQSGFEGSCPSPGSRWLTFNWGSHVPKGLTFSGKREDRDVWLTYAHQLENIKNYELGKEDAGQVLFYTLTDKALNFAVKTTKSRIRKLDYEELLAVLARHFGRQPRPEDAHLRLQNASQRIIETLDEWVDRVEIMARQASGSNMAYNKPMLSVAIKRFCLGCRDKRAGQKAYEQGPSRSLSEAIDKIEWFLHINKAASRSFREDWAD